LEECIGLSLKSNGQEKKETSPVDISNLDLYQFLEIFVMLLSEQAWRYMGLKVDPRTNEVNKDFEKAHVAIDCIISLVDKIESHIIGDEKDRYRKLITDLQINYVQQMNKK
jgi:hypothetical protein